jgi:2'-5' RNA ligase
MGFAVEMYFDEKSTQIIQNIWQSIGSINLKINASPHITLSLHEKMDIEYFKQILETFTSQHQKIPINISSISIFLAEEGIIFLAPVVTEPLLNLHKEFHHLLKTSEIETDDNYKPGNWVPHCTLDMELGKVDLQWKFMICRDLEKMRDATLESIGLVYFRPVTEYFRFSLQSVSPSLVEKYIPEG